MRFNLHEAFIDGTYSEGREVDIPLTDAGVYGEVIGPDPETWVYAFRRPMKDGSGIEVGCGREVYARLVPVDTRYALRGQS